MIGFWTVMELVWHVFAVVGVVSTSMWVYRIVRYFPTGPA